MTEETIIIFGLKIRPNADVCVQDSTDCRRIGEKLNKKCNDKHLLMFVAAELEHDNIIFVCNYKLSGYENTESVPDSVKNYCHDILKPIGKIIGIEYIGCDNEWTD